MWRTSTSIEPHNIHGCWDVQGRPCEPAGGQFSAVSPQTPSGCALGCGAAGSVPSCQWSGAGVSAPQHHPGSPRAPGPGAGTAAAGSAICPTAAWPPPLPGSCSGGGRDREGRGYPGKAEQRGREQLHIYPEKPRMRSLLLKTLPTVSMQDSSIRQTPKQIPNQEASSMPKCLMGNGARNAEIPDYSLFLCSCQLKRGNRLWSLPSATQCGIKS